MRELFNDDWTFAKRILSESENQKLLSPKDFYNEKEKNQLEYSKVSIPHDWLIYDTKNLYQSSVGFYKKEFTIENNTKEELYFLRFEGVYQNWAAFINGKLAFEWKYGYSTVEFCISPFFEKEKNTIEIIAVYQNPNSRWYSGAGIFRNIYLIKTEKTRIAPDGIYFHAEPLNSSDEKNLSDWKITIETELASPLENSIPDGLQIKHIIFDDQKPLSFFDGREVMLSKSEHQFCSSVKEIIPWDIENPHLYTLKTLLFDKNGIKIDEAVEKIGFRKIAFTPDKGFFLNNRHIIIHGVCEHHDFGLLGAEFNLQCLRRKVKKLREMGVNAIRCSHNPPPQDFLDFMDKEGLLVCDECFDMWEKAKTKFDYSNYFNSWCERDCTLWVKKDRNHPCVIMWSIGNEISDTNFKSGLEITKKLKKIVRRHDRLKNALVTSASNHMGNQLPQKCADELDLVGYNYAERLYDEHHLKNPTWCIYGSETGSHLQSRGIYHFPYRARPLLHYDNQCSSLGNTSVSWGARDANFTSAQDSKRPYTAGQFLWTGFDYIGEPTPYTTKNSYFGQIDTAGFEKDSFYVYKAAWTDAKENPFIHIFPYWDWNQGQTLDLCVCTNAPAAELFVNGKSFGKKISPDGKPLCQAIWEGIKYQKGKISAICYDSNGKEICREEKQSFSDAYQIEAELEEDFNFGESSERLYFFDISASDVKGIAVENACSIINIKVYGNAELLGADNGDSTDFDNYRSQDKKSIFRRLFSGKLLAIAKAEVNADFSIIFESKGLSGKEIILKNGKIADSKILKEEAESAKESFVPIRKVEIFAEGPDNLLLLDKKKQSVSAKFIVHPKNASLQKLEWKARMERGVESDCVEISYENSEIKVTAKNDGNFILSCFASNQKSIPLLTGEIEGRVSGLGNSSKNPYEHISASRCEKSSSPVELCFGDGVKSKEKDSWFFFENVDFGDQGSDCININLYSARESEVFSIWEGSPEQKKKIGTFTYQAKSEWETYKQNSFTLSARLFGKKNISFMFDSQVCFEGFDFMQSKKAFSKLKALDASSITGDSFTRTKSCVKNIGNNVSLEFSNMDFGGQKAEKITICGNSPIQNNIELVITDESKSIRTSLHFQKTKGTESQSFDIESLSGKTTVSFIFLPGSNFDFEWFKFE